MIKYPSPEYSKSNYLFIVENKIPLSRSFLAMVAGGYVFTYQQNNFTDGTPTIRKGAENNYATYKLALRYLLKDKGFVEAVYGAYDVFNPYLLSSPFFQVAFEHEISKRLEFYSYFRYQYNNAPTVLLNNFLGLGVKVHFGKN